jgi:hypothetical protein
VALDDTFRPPAAVARAGRKALEVRAEKPPSQRGMTPVGLRRAAQLANREPVSVRTLRRMLGYLSRHLVDKSGSTWADKGKGWQAWHGWGGDAGARWAASVLRRNDSDWFDRWRRAPRNRRLLRAVGR